jgi:hypothetical protein
MTRMVHWVSRSKDKKVGDVMVSYSPIETCPDSCSLKSGGCYAWGLFYLKILGTKISDGRLSPKTLSIASKKKNPLSKIARHRVAGDIVGDVPSTIDECKQIELMGLINIGYTHDWRSLEAQPLKKWFRASCQSIEELLEARALGWSTTLIVDKGSPKRVILPNGESAFKCPARIGVSGKKDIDCNTCTLCKVNDKTANKTIMFEIHGSKSTLSKASGKTAKI